MGLITNDLYTARNRTGTVIAGLMALTRATVLAMCLMTSGGHVTCLGLVMADSAA
jgi:hypothetical protein